MKFVRLTTTDPYYNLAVEEFLFSNTDEDVFMLWQNSPTVVIGKNQNAYAEIDLRYAEAHSINVARRITGGGAVYHDMGNINYSYITLSGGTLDFERLSKPIINALKEMGINAILGGRNDILVETKKISGSAQHTSNGRTLHHGTLLFDVDIEKMSSVLRTDKEKLEHHGVKSHKSRVANIKEFLASDITVSDFTNTLKSLILEELGASVTEIGDYPEIKALAERNRSREWIFSSKKLLTDYTVKRNKRYPFGSVELAINLEGNMIKNITVTGDFFSLSPIEELENALAGRQLGDLTKIDIAEYISGMTNEDFSDLLTPQQ